MSYKLNSGHTIPLLGFGTWQSGPNEVGNAVKLALKTGYKHLDLAKVYQNQPEIGKAIKESGVKREDVFITSKLWNSSHRPENVEPALDDTLKDLGLDYLDLYLIHWPVAFEAVPPPTANLFPKSSSDPSKASLDVSSPDSPSIVDTWKAMLKLVDTGKVKSVGVSNFTSSMIVALIEATGTAPAVNQIERHPLLMQPELIKYHKEKKIHITAYSLLGNNSVGAPLLVEHPKIKEIASRLDVTPAQVLISWAMLGEHSAIPKSVTPKRIEENFRVIELDANTVTEIESIGEQKRYNMPYTYKPSWDIDVFGDEAEKGAKYQVKTK